MQVFIPSLAGDLHSSPSNNNSPLISRILLSIQDYFNSAVVWMILIPPQISWFIGIVLRAPFLFDISVSFMLHSFFFQFSDKVQIIIIITPLRVFPTSISWWFSTGVWVTASFLKSPGLFSEFWPILIML